MGAQISSWWWGGDPDVLNSVSNLSKREVYNIQKTWAPIYAEAGKYGLEIFKRLFHTDPETKTFFKAIQHKSEEEISNSYQFKAHAINFMSAFNMAILNLQQPEVVIAMMNKLGETHNKRYIEKKHFMVVKTVLVGFLTNDLKVSDAELKSWGKAVDFMYIHIFEQLNA